MWKNDWFATWIALLSLLATYQTVVAQFMEIKASVEIGGKTPQQLVDIILDQNSGIQLVGMVTTNINAPGQPTSNLRAMGTFSHGMTQLLAASKSAQSKQSDGDVRWRHWPRQWHLSLHWTCQRL
jgi:hypothetical protein